MISIEKLTKKFGEKAAIKDVSLKFDKKEAVVIIGASGSGKTTLLRCINHLEEPTSGHVMINDKKLTKRNRGKLCFKIGMVFQQFNLFPHMSVLQNLTYGPINVQGKKESAAQKKAEKLLDKFGLLDKINAAPNDLSGGQKQRVAICRALMMDPEVILFDEPTSALDPEVVKDIIKIIEELKSQITMIVITHHVKFAKVIADRVVFMDKGLVLADQKAKDFFKKPSSHRARLFLENVGDLI